MVAVTDNASQYNISNKMLEAGFTANDNGESVSLRSLAH